jgi:hypothetical protein
LSACPFIAASDIAVSAAEPNILVDGSASLEPRRGCAQAF